MPAFVCSRPCTDLLLSCFSAPSDTWLEVRRVFSSFVPPLPPHLPLFGVADFLSLFISSFLRLPNSPRPSSRTQQRRRTSRRRKVRRRVRQPHERARRGRRNRHDCYSRNDRWTWRRGRSSWRREWWIETSLGCWSRRRTWSRARRSRPSSKGASTRSLERSCQLDYSCTYTYLELCGSVRGRESNETKLTFLFFPSFLRHLF